MRRLSIILLISLYLQAGAYPEVTDHPPKVESSEPIPLRSPKHSESRPGWWWDCWGGHIVVIEGSIEFTTTKADRVKLEISPEALKKHYERQEDRELRRSSSILFIGDLKVKKVLFVSPGIEFIDREVSAMVSGECRKAKVLLPALTLSTYPDEHDVDNLTPGRPNSGVFIFRYGSPLTTIPMVYSDVIPAPGIKNARNVFAYREKFDHIKRAESN